MSDAVRERLRHDFLLEGKPCPVTGLDDPAPGAARPACAIAIGVFDGMHEGHRDLLARTVADARGRGLAAVAVTFDPDPDQVLSDHPAHELLSSADRIDAISRSGVDEVLVIPFTPELAALDHATFFERVVLPVLDVRAIHVGRDFRLGAGGAAGVNAIRAWGERRGIEVLGHELLSLDGAVITATRVRGLLAAGELERAERELGRRHFVRGEVVRGRSQGASMGFPTANVALPALAQRPREGVYAGWAFDGRVAWPAAINVGVPPTFAGQEGVAELEANILGFSGDLYGHALALLFCEFLRSSRVFDTQEELVATVLGNIEDVRRRYGDEGVELVP